MKGKDTEEKMKNTVEFPSVQSKDSAKIFKRITLGGLLLFLFLSLYIPSLLNWLSGGNIARDVIRNGIIEEYIRCSAVIVRTEKALEPSAIEGRYIAEIAEGEKTSAYSKIAMVMNETSDELLSDLEELNAKIVKARMEKAEKEDFFSEDLARLDDEIGLEVQKLILACNSRSFTDMGRYRNDIGKIVEKKAEIVGENSADSYISSLQKQKEELQHRINNNTVEVVSNISGIVSYTIDGFESVLTPDILDELTPARLDKIREQDSLRQPADGKVKAGSPAAKIIRGTDIYLAAAIPAEKAADFEAGNRISLRINGVGLETAGYVTAINKGDNERSVVVVRMSRGADVLSSERVVDVDFITKTEEGLKVPVSSLRDITADGSGGRIMLIKYNVASNRIIDIVCRDEEYAIIRTPENEYKKTVSLYDTYIINPDHIEEGEIIEK